MQRQCDHHSVESPSNCQGPACTDACADYTLTSAALITTHPTEWLAVRTSQVADSNGVGSAVVS